MSKLLESHSSETNYFLPSEKGTLNHEITVVFSGSSTSISGWSGNDFQHIGSQI